MQRLLPIALDCERVTNCERYATHRITTGRIKDLPVCTYHLDQMVQQIGWEKVLRIEKIPVGAWEEC